MPIPRFFATKQGSTTTGTGTLTLIAGDTTFRQFEAAVTGAQPVYYSARLAGSTQWEFGIGTYDDGTPGTLTRTTVLWGSSGPGSLVNFDAGVKDVWLQAMPASRELWTFSASTSLAATEYGGLVVMTGSTGRTLSLPVASTVPRNVMTRVHNAGTGGAALLLDPNGSETINGATTLALMPGESVEICSDGTAWYAVGLASGMALVQTQSVSGTPAEIDFALPVTDAEYELAFSRLNFSADAQLSLRVSTDGGSTFDSGGSDYSTSYNFVTGASTTNTNATTGSAILLTDTADSIGGAYGSCRFDTGSPSKRFRLWAGSSIYADPASAPLLHGTFAGGRIADAAASHIRLRLSTGTFVSGSASLRLVRR
ncbi:hypothetical protein [Falsiroseomonas selenitidurans]|uniref:Uncharacterized protein n=1 Tax=Falsiroseomonas selenitidurans TaxID=2716335 RepID=A0ABX1EDA2_9PROT|nr:hypothetical protein [Falsiroseomonas selenitidurans]NKC33502.1 hypothetical protein [Falsiroseomonas selenitidurans]